MIGKVASSMFFKNNPWFLPSPRLWASKWALTNGIDITVLAVAGMKHYLVGQLPSRPGVFKCGVSRLWQLTIHHIGNQVLLHVFHHNKVSGNCYSASVASIPRHSTYSLVSSLFPLVPGPNISPRCTTAVVETCPILTGGDFLHACCGTTF